VRAWVGLAFTLLTLVGCSVERLPVSESPPPSPSPSASVRLSPVASPAITPEPTLLVAQPIPSEPWPDAEVPDGPLVRTASARVDGVDVRITLDANPLVAGKPAWVTTELTNLGRDRLYWYGPGCGIDVSVEGRIPGLEWRLGANQPGIAGKFKQSALWNANIPDERSLYLDFVPEGIVKQGIRSGEYGCLDIAIREELRPGRRFRDRMQWDGLVYLRAGLPPTSLADITGTFSRWWRASDPNERRREPIVVHLPTWIRGIDAPPSLSVGEAVDVALTHDTFAEWVKQRIKRKDQWHTVTDLDPATGTWQIGLAQHGTGDTRIVVVDSASGRPKAYLSAKIDGAGRLTHIGPAD
jgi:hypothetical protein